MLVHHIGRAEFAIAPRHGEVTVAEQLLQEEGTAVVQQYHGEAMAEARALAVLSKPPFDSGLTSSCWRGIFVWNQEITKAPGP